MKTPSNLIRSCIACVALCAFLSAPSHAANKTWTGTNGTLWSDGGNWGGTAPLTDGTDFLYFTGSTNPASTNDFTNATFDGNSTYGIIINSTAAIITLSGNDIILKNDVNLVGNRTHAINVNMAVEESDFKIVSDGSNVASQYKYINGTISETGSGMDTFTVVPGGASNLVLNGNNTFEIGSIRLQNGLTRVTRIGNASETGNLGKSPLIVIGNAASRAILVYTGAGESTDRQIQIGNGTGATHDGYAQINAEGSGDIIFTNATFNVLAATATANRTLRLSGSSNGTILGVIADNNAGAKVGLTGAGGSTWRLNGNNTFSNPSDLSDVYWIAGHNYAFGSSVLSVSTGYSIALDDGITIANPITFLNNASVNPETIKLSTNATSATWAGNMTNSANGSASVSNGIALSADANQTLTVSGNIDGTGNATVRKKGAGAVLLTGNNSYTANTTISAGVLSINGTASLPGWNVNGRYSVANDAALAVSNAVSDADALTMMATTNYAANGGFGFDTSAGNRTYGSVLAPVPGGAQVFAKAGSNTLFLTAANTFNGTTRVFGGTLSLSNLNALQNATLDTGTPGAQQVTFDVAGANTYNIGGLKGSDDLAIGANTLSVGATNAGSTFDGVLSGSGNLTKTGTGDFTLTGNNTYDGVTTISGGKIILGNPNATVGSTIGATVVQNGAQFFVSAGASAVVYLEENFTITGIGLGTAGANNGALGMQMNSGIVTYNGTITLNGGATLGTFNAGTATMTFTKGIAGTGDLTIRANSGGGGNGNANWHLLGQSSYTGNTVFNTGSINGTATINNGIDNALPPTTVLYMNGTVAAGANSTLTYVLNGHNQTLAGLGGGSNGISGNYSFDNTITGGNTTLSTLTVNSTADHFFNGTIGGSGTNDNNLALVKDGPGNQTLAGNITYTGNTTVKAGTLQINNASLADGADVRLSSNGTLNLNFNGTDTVHALYIDNVQQTNGTWGGTGSNATHTSSLISGTGWLNVTTGSAASNFSSWAAGYNVTNSTTANDDADKFLHGEEYAFDLDPTVKEYGNVLASATSLSGGNVTMTLAFNGNSSKQDINYVVRRANNPGFTSNTIVGFWNGTNNWSTSNSTYFANETQSGNGTVKAINVNMSIPAATEPRQFLKVNIE